jgi:outer membrane protein, heavy metal efflux system
VHVSFMNHSAAVALLLLHPLIAPTHAQQGAALTLGAAISRALATHPSVGAADQAVRAAKGTRLTARSWSNPSFNYQREEASSAAPGHGTTAMSRETMTFGMLPLEPIYQLWPRASQASAEVRAAEADLGAARRTIALNAAAAFFSVASAQVSVEALVDVRGWLDSLVAYTRARVGEGAAAEVDLIRLEVEHGRVQTDLAMARVDLARSRAQLARMVGTDSFALAAATDTFEVGAPLPAREALLTLARERRPELLAARARVDAARSGVSVERSRIVREVGVMAGVKTMAGSRSLMTGISLPVPLFDQNRGEIRRADANRRIAAFELEQVEREVAADVSASYAAVQALTEQLDLMQGSLLRRAEEARRIAEAAYREGATSLIQVLDAARAFAEARQVYYRAQFARQQSILELNAAIGASDVAGLLSAPTSSIPPRREDQQ